MQGSNFIIHPHRRPLPPHFSSPLYRARDFHIRRIAIYEALLRTWERRFMFA